MVMLAFASAISVLSISPVLADNGHGRGNGNSHNRNHNDHDRRRGYQQPYGYYRSGRRQIYTYAQPVYVPPPVYYRPLQAPGVNLFFPLNLR